MKLRKKIQAILEKHIGEVERFTNEDGISGFSAKKYIVHYENDNKDVPAMLMISDCFEIEKPIMDDISITQTWDCPDAGQILEACKYQVIGNDMMAAGLPAKQRAELLVGFIEALMEIFPGCKAVITESSKKMLTRDAIVNCDMTGGAKFIYYAVNVRFFNIQGSGDMMVDTVGMSTLFLPDLQYHFHGMDPNHVVNHAYNFLTYIFDNDNPMKPGDGIDGIKDGHMSMEIQWETQYEQALIQPVREVLDVNMGEYAAGNR